MLCRNSNLAEIYSDKRNEQHINGCATYELKATSFDPRDAGQMNFYLNAVDAILKSPEDNPSIGLLLCKDKKGLKVEYALQGIRKPIGVASYEVTIVEKLPKELKGSLPTVQEIEAELENM